MSLKLIFTIYSIYNILLGLAFIFVPSAVMDGAGITPTTDLVVTQQIWGAAIIGIGWVAFQLRGADDNAVLIGVVKSFMVVAALTLIVTAYHFTLGFAGPPIYINFLINLIVIVGIFIKTK